MKERKKNGGSDSVAIAQNLAAAGLHRGVARRSWQAQTGVWGQRTWQGEMGERGKKEKRERVSDGSWLAGE
ncbi:uncharacterized protein DS421_7g220770 [Arachis hypogaea]|nr:uncharacterized protein DS421_7g220770 [Arachis hypogaea]